VANETPWEDGLALHHRTVEAGSPFTSGGDGLSDRHALNGQIVLAFARCASWLEVRNEKLAVCRQAVAKDFAERTVEVMAANLPS
jgi:hypothetical protein